MIVYAVWIVLVRDYEVIWKNIKRKSSSSLCLRLYNSQLSYSWLNRLTIVYPLVHLLLITIVYMQCLIGNQSASILLHSLVVFWNVLGIDDNTVIVPTFQMFYRPNYIYTYICMQMLPLLHIGWLIDNPLYYSWCSFFILISERVLSEF